MLAALALALACPAVLAAEGTPAAVVDEPLRELGRIGVGEPAVVEFRVENRGRAPLTLEPKAGADPPREVRVEVTGSPAAPGKAARVAVEVDTAGVAGKARFAVPLVTNDPKQETLTLTVALDVHPFLVARPGFARYIVVRHETEGTIGQTIAATDGSGFRVTGVESPSPALRVSFRKARDGERTAELRGSQWRVESTLRSDAPVGPLTGEILVRTDHPKQRTLRIPVSGFVRPILAVTPPRAEVGEIDPAAGATASLHVQSFSTAPIEVRGADCDVPGITAEVVPVTAGRVYKVRLRFGPKLPAGEFSGTVRIRTASPHRPVVEVPLRGRTARGASGGR